MTEKNEQALAGVASELNAELDVLREENERLLNANKALTHCVNVATSTIEQLTKELSDIREATKSESFKTHWLMQYAGLAMQSQLSQIDIVEYDANYKTIAKEAFLAANAMIEMCKNI